MRMMIEPRTGRLFLVEDIERGESPIPSPEILDTLAEQITTLQNNDSELGDQVQGIQGELNTLKVTAVTKVGNHDMEGELSVKDRFQVSNDEGGLIEISFLGPTTQIATNDGLDILSNTNFLVSPTTEDPQSFNSLDLNNLTSKQQVLQAIQSIYKEKMIFVGVPSAIDLNEVAKPVEFPKNVVYVDSESFIIKGDSIIVKNNGTIRISRDVRLNYPLSDVVHYELRINGESIDVLKEQSIIISSCPSSYHIDFYATVKENDELSIMASTGGNTVTPSYKGIISTIEYV